MAFTYFSTCITQGEVTEDSDSYCDAHENTQAFDFQEVTKGPLLQDIETHHYITAKMGCLRNVLYWCFNVVGIVRTFLGKN